MTPDCAHSEKDLDSIALTDHHDELFSGFPSASSDLHLYNYPSVASQDALAVHSKLDVGYAFFDLELQALQLSTCYSVHCSFMASLGHLRFKEVTYRCRSY